MSGSGRTRQTVRRLFALLLSLMGLQQHVHAQANPFTCDGTLYLSQSTSLTGQLFWINRANNPFTYPPLGLPGLTLNALAYNPADNFLYALRPRSTDEGRRLYRINALGVRTDLGLVSGLPAPTGSAYFAGAFTPAGNIMYVMTATLANGTYGDTMYRIDVTTMTATPLVLSRPIYFADLAYANGLFYAFETAGQLVSIDPDTGVVTNIGSPQAHATIGAFYADANGLYGVGNSYDSSSGAFYRFDAVTGQRTLISDAPPSSSNDGARCPLAPPLSFSADLAITKTDHSATYTRGEDVVYTIVASNNGPFGAQNARVQDMLPSGISTASWTCVAAGGAECRTASGSGAIDARVDLPVGGTATFTLTMAIPLGFTGDLVNTATVSPDVANTDPVPENNSAVDTDVARTALTLQKALPLGRARAADQFALSINGTGAPAAVSTTGSGTMAAGSVTHVSATPGEAYTLSEMAAGTTVQNEYVSTYACTNTRPGGQTPSGSGTSFEVTPLAGDDLTCTFTNVPAPDLSITKTNTPELGANDQPDDLLLSGNTATYVIVARNNGLSEVADAVVRDVPATGLRDCRLASPACQVTSGTATCPAVGAGAGQLSIENLQDPGVDGGVRIPAMHSGGEVTLRISCTVQ